MEDIGHIWRIVTRVAKLAVSARMVEGASSESGSGTITVLRIQDPKGNYPLLDRPHVAAELAVRRELLRPGPVVRGCQLANLANRR